MPCPSSESTSLSHLCLLYTGGAKSKPSSTARTMSRNVKRLQEAVNLHLNHYEKELFLDALNEYHSQKDSWGFVELLRTILNTPAKQLLVGPYSVI